MVRPPTVSHPKSKISRIALSNECYKAAELENGAAEQGISGPGLP